VLAGAHAPFDMLFGFYSKLVPRWLNAFAKAPTQDLQSRRNSLEQLVDHVSTVAISALVSSTASSTAIANYFLTVAEASLTVLESVKAPKPIPVVLPPPRLFYMLLFAPSLDAVSATLSALAIFKVVVERVLKIPSKGRLADLVSASNNTALASLNAYLLDTANLLWRSRALAPDPPANTACMVPEATRKALMAYLPALHRHYSLPLVFGLTGHTLLSGTAHAAWRGLEDELLTDGDKMLVDTAQDKRHTGPVSQRSLAALGHDGGVVADWREVRQRIVGYLDSRGADGFERFRKAAMGNR
jgi:centromere protein I